MLLLLMFLFIFPINAGISNIKRAQTLELLKSFFNSHFLIKSRFVHIISKDSMQEDLRHIIADKLQLLDGKEMAGLCTVHFAYPMAFKFKYCTPRLVQVVKQPKGSTYYKIGQFKTQSDDNIVMHKPDKTAPKLISHDFSLISIFDKTLQEWISKINVLDVHETKHYLYIKIASNKHGIRINRPMILTFTKPTLHHPPILVQWSFYSDGKLNQITLFQPKIYTKLRAQTVNTFLKNSYFDLD